MNILSTEPFKNIKIGDLTLGILSFVNLIYPAFVIWYFFDIDFITNTDAVTLLLISISVGFLFNITTLHSLGRKRELEDVTFTFESIKSIMPLIIVYQAFIFLIIFLLIYLLSLMCFNDTFNSQHVVFVFLSVFIIASFLTAKERKKPK